MHQPKDHDTMTDPTHPLSVDEAMAEFQAIAREVLADASPHPGSTPAAPAQTNENHFRPAEFMLSLACPDPRACRDQRCRRGGLCRHFAHVRALQQGRASHHPRRTPGAEAARYAVWVYMNSGR
jgi:hypothetical protein